MTHTMTVDRETLLKLYKVAPDSDTKELIRDIISTMNADEEGAIIHLYFGEGWNEARIITEQDVKDFDLEGWEKLEEE